MNLRKALTFTLLILFTLSACAGPAPERTQLTRSQELADTGLLGRHPIKGVNVEGGYQGNFDGGYFLFGGGVSGEISPATNFIIEWSPRPNVSYITTISRAKIVTNTVVYTADHPGPEIEFIFAEAWLNETNLNNPNTPLYTAESKLDLNQIIASTYDWGTPALIIVNVYISADDQAGINR